jgi:peptidoglycan/xylan/chitin deacetylase (PgdA/CDA1 family)
MRHRRQEAGREGYSPTAGLHFDDQEFESRLVWIWTMARSGSTWFLRMLTHPLKLVDSSQDPEDMLGFVAPRTWQGTVDAIPVDTTFVSNHLMPIVGAANYNEKLDPVTFSAALGLRKRANYLFSTRYEDAWAPELRRMMLVRFHRLVERTAERHEVSSPLVLLKEVAGAHAAPLVMSMFPRSKAIFLVRDGRDVVDSQTAANQPGTWLPVSGWKTSEERRDFVARRAHNWVGDVASIQRAMEPHPAELQRTVRYEDLLADPASNLASLVEWLGLRRSSRWLERAVEANSFESIAPERKGPKKFYRSATPGAWRENMTEGEAATLESLMAEKLRELGYPVAEGQPAGEALGDDDASEDAADAAKVEADGMAPEGEGGTAALALEEGSSEFRGGVVSSAIRRLGEGRDYSDLGRLVNKRGSPASRRDRMVAVTFDDGPVLQTHRVLDTLRGHDARATFFLVGYKMDGHAELMKRIQREGHEIGNHSHGHYAYPERDDVAACSALIQHLNGAPPKLFRPPFGAIDRPCAEAAIEDGLQVILWNVDSEDGIPPWQGISAEEITRNVLDNIVPGAIVLLHDGLPWSRAAEALPALIEGIIREGYRMVTVSELLADHALQRPSPARRVMRRLGHRLGINTGTGEAVAPPRASETNGGAPRESDGAGNGHLAELLEKMGEGLEAPEDMDPVTARLIRGASLGLADPRTASDLLARNTAALEVNSVRVMALGFSLRRFESAQAEAAALPDQFSARLRDAADPGAEAGAIAQELAGRMRVRRLVAARLSRPAGEANRNEDPGAESASPEFLSIFEPGADTWERLESWAQDTCRRVARQRMRALLDAAGVDAGFDIERLIERLDAEYYFRFGYALAACEEELARAIS